MMLVWFQVVVGVLVGLCQRQLQFWVRKLEMIQECAATTKNTAVTHRSLCFAALVEVAREVGGVFGRTRVREFMRHLRYPYRVRIFIRK